MPSKARLKSQYPLPTAAGGLDKGFIAGLYMKYNSAASLTLSEGAAYIPGTSTVLELAAPITLSGLTLTANTWYHLYLYNNAGTPAIELVTTAPDTPYFGKARGKTGDASRRYVGSALSLAANTLAKFTHTTGRIAYGELSSSAVFGLVNNTTAVSTIVSAAGVVPVTGTHLSCVMLNNATDFVARLGNPDLMNPVSTTQHTLFVTLGAHLGADLPLSAAQAFAWRHDSAANGTFSVRSYGYLFER